MPNGDVYDLAGDVTNDGANKYLYDGEGRLCAVQSLTSGGMTEYIYDAEGQRVMKGTISTFSCNPASNGFSVTTLYTRGLNGEDLTELVMSGGNYQWDHTNVFANGELLATYKGTETYFALNDWLGTKRAEATPDGNLATYSSLPWGNELSASGSIPDATAQHFTGKERDSESGNDFFGARYYASSMGRFLSPDWSATPESIPYASLSNPESLNLYGYTGNNPLSKTDEDGHCSAPSVSAGHVGICLESYIQRARLGFALQGLGDNRGPVANDPQATFRTQTMIDVNLGSQFATETTEAGISKSAHEGQEPGVAHHWISDLQKGSDGSTTFTVHVFGENGFEAKGGLEGRFAPTGWLEMVITLNVASDGKVTVVDQSTKKFPSVSIYSYQSNGDISNVYQQKESGDWNDLNKPRGQYGSNICGAEDASCNGVQQH